MSMLPKDKNQRVLVQLVGVVVVMGALAWAAVPFYNWFCRVTGYGGTTQVAESHDEAADILDEKITIRFDGNTDPNLPWTFRPMQTEMTLQIGQDGLAFYEAVNNSDKPITGRASYNVAPEIAGSFFVKIECFCFTEQTLAPGQEVSMPVLFYVDAAMADDIDARDIRKVTLSYTFYRTDADDKNKAKPADVTAAVKAGGNG